MGLSSAAMTARTTSRERIRRRRRIVVRAGAAVLLALTATACIFDKGGDYKGGGRRNAGADISQGSDTATAAPDGAPTSTATTDSGGGVPDTGPLLPDVGVGGG